MKKVHCHHRGWPGTGQPYGCFCCLFKELKI